MGRQHVPTPLLSLPLSVIRRRLIVNHADTKAHVSSPCHFSPRSIRSHAERKAVILLEAFLDDLDIVLDWWQDYSPPSFSIGMQILLVHVSIFFWIVVKCAKSRLAQVEQERKQLDRCARGLNTIQARVLMPG